MPTQACVPGFACPICSFVIRVFSFSYALQATTGVLRWSYHTKVS